MLRVLLLTSPWLLAALTSGCGNEEPLPELTPTTGVVKINGEPAAGVSVLFTPTDDTPGDGAWGVTDSQGVFVLKHKSQAEGIPPGNYVVHFSRFMMPDGTPSPPNKSPYESGARESIPREWSDRIQSSPLNTVTIQKGSDKPLEFNVLIRQ